jgi:phospholipase/carboxylesterase
MNDPHGHVRVARTGCELGKAAAAILMLHGRGATAEDILGLASEFPGERIAYLAPQAAGNSWYPYSFLAPIEQNQPWLGSALALVQSLVKECMAAGVPRTRFVLCGFSQGACLATEFIASHPARYGALVAFTGGLIGPPGADLHHAGSLDGTRVLLSSGDPDPHVPWARVETSARELERMKARVRLMRYPGRPHTILPEELEAAREIVDPILAPGLLGEDAKPAR